MCDDDGDASKVKRGVRDGGDAAKVQGGERDSVDAALVQGGERDGGDAANVQGVRRRRCNKSAEWQARDAKVQVCVREDIDVQGGERVDGDEAKVQLREACETTVMRRKCRAATRRR